MGKIFIIYVFIIKKDDNSYNFVILLRSAEKAQLAPPLCTKTIPATIQAFKMREHVDLLAAECCGKI